MTAGFGTPIEDVSHVISGFIDRSVDGVMSDKGKRFFCILELMFAIPILTSLTGVQGIQKVGRYHCWGNRACLIFYDRTIANGAEVRDRHFFTWRCF